MQRLPSARQRYQAAIRASRSQFGIQKERERIRIKLERMPQADRADYLDNQRKEAEKREVKSGKLFLHRYQYLPEIEQRKLVKEEKDLERAKFENLGLRHDFRVGKRVAIARAPKMKGVRGLQGRIGTVAEIKRLEGVAVVEGLEQNQVYTIPLTHLLPIQTTLNPSTSNPEEIVLIPSHAERDFQVRRQFATRERQKIVNAKLKTEGRPQRNPKKTHEVDTERDIVGLKTWTPQLMSAPLPLPIIDELRGKYSKFRRRWMDEELGVSTRMEKRDRKAEKIAERTKRMEGLSIGNVLAELSLKERDEKRREEEMRGGNGEVPEEGVLEVIGRAMARSGVTLPAADVNAPSRSSRGGEYDVEDKDHVASQHLGRGEQVPQGTPAVAAKAADAALKVRRRQGREDSAVYWPVKGWKDKQRLGARQAIQEKTLEQRRRELVRQMVPREVREGAVEARA